MKENEILEKAIQQFTEITGAGITILDKKLIINEKNDADAALEMRLGQQKTQFWVEIKNEIREQNIPRILNQVKDNPGNWLLICQYIPKPVKENLKNRGINYLEAAGNCFIKKDGLFFYINDRAVTAQRQPKEGKLWKQTGLKFLFGILLKPELLNETYRAIAKITGVALGNIGPFIEELKREGFLNVAVKNGNAYLLLENIEMLRNKWVALFNVVLKPKLKQGQFRFIDKKMMNQWELLPNIDLYWGGETAGALLTNFLQPEIFTLYTEKPKTKIMEQLRLIPDTKGNVVIMKKFWNDELDFKQGNVPPLLVYAELITSLDSRNRETAERIKQQYLD